MNTRTLLLRAIPVAGWLALAYGGGRALAGNPVRHPAVRAVLWVDAFLSFVVHGAQIPAAIRTAGGSRSRLSTAALTMVFGMTWWKTQPTTTETAS